MADSQLFQDDEGQWWEIRGRVTIGGFVSEDDGQAVVDRSRSLIDAVTESMDLQQGDEILILRPRSS